MVQINGQLVPAYLLAQSQVNNNQTVRVRQQMLQELKNKTQIKKGANIDLEKLKSTFQTTDLMSKAKNKNFIDDPVERDLEGDQDISLDDGSDDAEYKEEDDEVKEAAVWDEEENIQSVKVDESMNSQDEQDACEAALDEDED